MHGIRPSGRGSRNWFGMEVEIEVQRPSAKGAVVSACVYLSGLTSVGKRDSQSPLAHQQTNVAKPQWAFRLGNQCSFGSQRDLPIAQIEFRQWDDFIKISSRRPCYQPRNPKHERPLD